MTYPQCHRRPYSSYACSRDGDFTAWWSCPVLRPSTTTAPKGGKNSPVFRFRTAGGPSTMEQNHRVQSLQREENMGDQDMIYVAAVVWAGREASLCGGYLCACRRCGREWSRAGQIRRSGADTEHTQKQRLGNTQRHQNHKRVCVCSHGLHSDTHDVDHWEHLTILRPV